MTTTTTLKMFIKLIVGLFIVTTIARFGEASSHKTSGSFCQGCRSMVSFMTKFNSSSNRADNKELFKNFCELYHPVSTDFRQGPCPFVVEGLFYMLEKMDPIYHCDVIGACSRYDKPISNDEEEFTVYPVKGVPVACDFCEQFIVNAQGELEDPHTIERIQNLLDSFCDYLAVVGQSKACKQMLESYIDEAIEFVRAINPLKYCQSVSLCPANKQQLTPHEVFSRFRGFGLETKTEIEKKMTTNEVSQYDKSNEKVKRGPNCVFCKTIVKEMFKFLKENRTEANIRVALNKVCKLVYHNGDKYEQCTTLVSSYTREFVEILVEETDPELICMLLEQCTYHKQELANAEPINMSQFISMLDSSVPVNSMKGCVECKLFVEYLRDQVVNPKTEDDAKKWLLKNLCMTLPDKNMSDSCVEMINAYSSTFFKALAQELEPKVACAELHACPAKQKVLLIDDLPVEAEQSPAVDPVEELEKPTTNPFCDQCLDILTRIDDYLSTHPLDHDVNVLIEQVCNNIPNENVKNQCTFLVKTFGQEIVQAITHESPKDFCTSMSMC